MSDTDISRLISEDIVTSIIDASPIGMMVFDASGRVVFSNQQAELIFGFNEEPLVGKVVTDLMPLRFRSYHRDLEREYLQSPIPKSMGSDRHIMGLRADGAEVPLEIGLSPLVHKKSQYILASVVDISDRLRVAELEALNKRLEEEATHDSLTGMPNRRMLVEFAENLRLLAVRNRQKLTLLFLDLDGFKGVNDQFGHHAGDRLLCEVARVLESAVRKSDIVGRYGGDEFLLCFVGDEKGRCGKRTAEQLLRAVESVRLVEGCDVIVSASVGVVSSVQPETVTIGEMIDAADKLMYEAKKEGLAQESVSRIVVGEIRMSTL